MAEQVFTGTGHAVDPAEALGQALGAALGQLIAAGGSAFDVRRMDWIADRPAAFHPARRAIDFARREAMAGIRPPVTVRHGAGRLTVHLQAELPARPVDDRPVWRDYTRAQLAQQYSPRSQVPSMQGVFDAWRREGDAWRARHPEALDIAYGPGPNHTLDLFLPDGVAKAPLWMFIHGGYFQAADKNQHAQFAAGLVRAGFAVAMPHYDLSPVATVAQITGQMKQALRFLHEEAEALGLDRAAIHIAGHSAGGHLAAMLAADRDGPPLRSALLLSGIFDCRPLALLPFGKVLGITDEASALAVSPALMDKRPGLRIGIAVGAKESDEFRRQSAEQAMKWQAFRPSLEVAGRQHFDLLEDLKGGGPLLDFALETAG